MSIFKGVALVTGASRGALRLAHDGYAVALNDIPSNLPILNAVKAEIESITYGGQKMVANAGILQTMAPMVDTSSKDDFDQTLAVNVRGVFLCYKYAAKQMITQHQQGGGAAGGNIIGASSVTAKQGARNEVKMANSSESHPYASWVRYC